MEKVCKKSARKTSPICTSLVNSPKQPVDVRDFWKKVVLKETLKKVTLFFPLHPVPFYEQDYEKQKRPGTSYLSLWVAKYVYKNSFFGQALWNWKLERKGKKIKH